MTVVAVGALVLVAILAIILLVRERDRERFAAELLKQAMLEREQLTSRVQRPEMVPRPLDPALPPPSPEDRADAAEWSRVGTVRPATLDPESWVEEPYDVLEDVD